MKNGPIVTLRKKRPIETRAVFSSRKRQKLSFTALLAELGTEVWGKSSENGAAGYRDNYSLAPVLEGRVLTANSLPPGPTARWLPSGSARDWYPSSSGPQRQPPVGSKTVGPRAGHSRKKVGSLLGPEIRTLGPGPGRGLDKRLAKR